MIEPATTGDVMSGEWFGLWSNLGTTLVGGIIAAGVAFILARQSSKEVLARDGESRKEKQKAELFRLLMKASLISNDVSSTMQAIDEMLRDANNAGRTAWQLHAKIMPIVGSIPDVTIEPDDLTALAAAREMGLINELTEVSMRYQSFKDSVKLYGNVRAGLKNTRIGSIEGSVIGAHLSKEEYLQIQPLRIELESLITQIIKDGRLLEKQATEVGERIGPAARKFLGDPAFPKFLRKPTSN